MPSGDAIARMEELAAKGAPGRMRYEWTGISLSRSERQPDAGDLALGLISSSWCCRRSTRASGLPFVIIPSVPLAILGAPGFQVVRGLVNDASVRSGW